MIIKYYYIICYEILNVLTSLDYGRRLLKHFCGLLFVVKFS